MHPFADSLVAQELVSSVPFTRWSIVIIEVVVFRIEVLLQRVVGGEENGPVGSLIGKLPARTDAPLESHDLLLSKELGLSNCTRLLHYNSILNQLRL